MIGAVIASVVLVTPPPIVLTATPARLTLDGSTRATVRVTNAGTRAVVVVASRAGFALDARGRPRVARSDGARSAARWLAFQPQRFELGPHASTTLVVASKLPRRAEPGDHDALVLLSTRPVMRARVAVRLRMGVVVVVRAPGKVVRRLELRRLRVAGRRKVQGLEVVVANRGNVTESLTQPRAVISRRGRWIATLVATSRELRPRTSGILEFRFRRRLRGLMAARVVIAAAPGRAVLRRTYRFRV
jgi:hypothetical protein